MSKISEKFQDSATHFAWPGHTQLSHFINSDDEQIDLFYSDFLLFDVS